MAAPIFHMCRTDEWEAAQKAGSHPGSSQDQADGFIHFSSGAQIVETAAKHRAGQDGLVLLRGAPLWIFSLCSSTRRGTEKGSITICESPLLGSGETTPTRVERGALSTTS